MRIRNQRTRTEGGFEVLPTGEVTWPMTQQWSTGHKYTIGSAGRCRIRNGFFRDWAARNLPARVKAVVAASFERIHRSNLVGDGVLHYV